MAVLLIRLVRVLPSTNTRYVTAAYMLLLRPTFCQYNSGKRGPGECGVGRIPKKQSVTSSAVRSHSLVRLRATAPVLHISPYQSAATD